LQTWIFCVIKPKNRTKQPSQMQQSQAYNPFDDRVLITILVFGVIFYIVVIIWNLINNKDHFVPDPDAPEIDASLVATCGEGYIDYSKIFLSYLISRANSELSDLKEPLGREEIEVLITGWRSDFRHSFYKTFEEDPDSEIRHKYVMNEFIKSLCFSGLLKSQKEEASSVEDNL